MEPMASQLVRYENGGRCCIPSSRILYNFHWTTRYSREHGQRHWSPQYRKISNLVDSNRFKAYCSIICTVSNVFENAVYQQTLNHLMSNNFIDTFSLVSVRHTVQPPLFCWTWNWNGSWLIHDSGLVGCHSSFPVLCPWNLVPKMRIYGLSEPTVV